MNRSSNPRTLFLSLAALLACALTLPAIAADDAGHAFGRLTDHYEAVRLALVDDTVDGTTEHTEAIQTIVHRLEADPDPASAGVDPADVETLRELLGDLRSAADALVAADGLEAARDAFYAFSKPLVRYRALVEGERPAVVYCPMARRSWLQPEESEIGNPYHGQSMETCGQFVEEGS